MDARFVRPTYTWHSCDSSGSPVLQDSFYSEVGTAFTFDSEAADSSDEGSDMPPRSYVILDLDVYRAASQITMTADNYDVPSEGRSDAPLERPVMRTGSQLSYHRAASFTSSLDIRMTFDSLQDSLREPSLGSFVEERDAEAAHQRDVRDFALPSSLDDVALERVSHMARSSTTSFSDGLEDRASRQEEFSFDGFHASDTVQQRNPILLRTRENTHRRESILDFR
eukprot:TRINITY_DN39945_c0_g1_i1.p1 TRINITY_DN39945_c0_g1~~TRINITY_DN39945_c0_g1_i1.p1  ORF type:complete len:235 (-),score=6.32 TRINITY_DN39945_c0_g1_i1:214-888(-)